MDIRQFRDFIVRPALQQINAWTLNVEQLVMATAMAESGVFFIHQIGRGPARGFFQMEPVTHDDIWERYLSRQPGLLNMLALQLSVRRLLIIASDQNLYALILKVI